MDKALKQRILGAIVLVALGVIFIPALLDGAGYRSREKHTVAIPLPPKFPPLSQTTLEPVATPIDNKIKQVVEEQKKQAATPVQSWDLQVGIFSTKASAESFAKTLQKEGHAYVDSTTVDGKNVYRVRIGPELDRARLEKLKDKLNTERKIKSFITTHP
jgi:DedD protein